MEWERLSRATMYEGRVVDVFRDQVRIGADTGVRETAYDVVHHPGAVAIVPLFGDGTIALLSQFRYAVGETIWEIPAGTLSPDETVAACAERELAEETGYRAEKWTQLSRFYTTPGFTDEEMYLFLAEQLTETDGELDEDEDIEVHRVPLETALEWVADGRIQDAKTLVGLFATRSHLDGEPAS